MAYLLKTHHGAQINVFCFSSSSVPVTDCPVLPPCSQPRAREWASNQPSSFLVEQSSAHETPSQACGLTAVGHVYSEMGAPSCPTCFPEGHRTGLSIHPRAARGEKADDLESQSKRFGFTSISKSFSFLMDENAIGLRCP